MECCIHQWTPVPNDMGIYHCPWCDALGRKDLSSGKVLAYAQKGKDRQRAMAERGCWAALVQQERDKLARERSLRDLNLTHLCDTVDGR